MKKSKQEKPDPELYTEAECNRIAQDIYLHGKARIEAETGEQLYARQRQVWNRVKQLKNKRNDQ